MSRGGGWTFDVFCASFYTCRTRGLCSQASRDRPRFALASLWPEVSEDGGLFTARGQCSRSARCVSGLATGVWSHGLVINMAIGRCVALDISRTHHRHALQPRPAGARLHIHSVAMSTKRRDDLASNLNSTYVSTKVDIRTDRDISLHCFFCFR